MRTPWLVSPSRPEVGRARDLAYGAVAAATAPLWLPIAVARGYHRTGWRRRFGSVSLPPPVGGPRVLLHGVSVGEVTSLTNLVPTLASLGFDPVVSATTDTGLTRAQTLFGGQCPVVQFPFDFGAAVKRFLDEVRPDLVALVELELWPNFVEECVARGVRVVVISGRISDKSAPRYMRLRPVLGDSFAKLTAVGAQTLEYAERFTQMGTQAERVCVTDSLKWDDAGDGVADDERTAFAASMGIDRARPLVVAGSTGPGEELLLANAWPDDVQLMVAPRKPERFEQVANELPTAVRRSQPDQTGGNAGGEGRLFLLDSLGELGLAYAVADVAVLGRSFNGMGGSNPIEPAARGCPVLVGPDHDNFSEAVERLRAAGGLEVTARDDIVSRATALARDKQLAKNMGDRALAVVEQARGATQRTAYLIERSLAGPPGAYGGNEMKGTTKAQR